MGCIEANANYSNNADEELLHFNQGAKGENEAEKKFVGVVKLKVNWIEFWNKEKVAFSGSQSLFLIWL